jgi:hypothetical protein
MRTERCKTVGSDIPGRHWTVSADILHDMTVGQTSMGDRRRNLKAAKQLGMETIRAYTRTYSWHTHATEISHSGVRIGGTLESLKVLQELIGVDLDLEGNSIVSQHASKL